jgi:hypothetical protein
VNLELSEYIDARGHSHYCEWVSKLDPSVRARIDKSVLRWALASLLAITFSSVATCGGTRTCEHNRPEEITFGPYAELGPVVAPDHNQMAFEYFAPTLPVPTGPEIRSMNIGQGFSHNRRVTTDTANYSGISWSSDSQWISLVRSESIEESHVVGRTISLLSSQIVKVRVSNGEIVQLTSFPKGTALGDDTAWSPGGFIAFQRDGKIYETSEDGRVLSLLLDPTSDHLRLEDPTHLAWSPDGSMIAFVARNYVARGETLGIWTFDIHSRATKRVASGILNAGLAWMGPHSLLFCKASKKNGPSVIWSTDTASTHMKRLTGVDPKIETGE